MFQDINWLNFMMLVLPVLMLVMAIRDARTIKKRYGDRRTHANEHRRN